MKFAVALAAGAACSVLGMLGSAEAGQYGGRFVYRPHRLPPVSGVLRMTPDAFGRGDGRMDRGRWAMQGEQRGRFGRARSPIVEDRFYGSGSDETDGFPSGRPYGHVYGPAYGRQADAFPQLARGGYGAREPGRFPHHAQRWNGDGTGVIGILGDGGSLFSSGRDVRPEAPLQVAYGEPQMQPPAYGMPPTGGLAYYGSGSPGRLPYYSSGSSAGPYGSPGDLALYNSGAYGPGPHVIDLSRRQAWSGTMRRNCTCGPQVIRVGQRQRHRADW